MQGKKWLPHLLKLCLQGIPSRPMAVAENAAQLDALTARSMARGALKREYMANLLRPAER